MKINHRITERHDHPFWLEIDWLGLNFERGDPDNVLGSAISVLNVTEDQHHWPEVERLVAEYDLGPHFVTNLFTTAELDAAEWLQIEALGHFGYPQPEDDYHDATYDLSDFCRICAIGGVQNAPFRLRAEPRATRRQFMQLHWVFDEFFVQDEAREGLSASDLTGFRLRPAVLHGSDRAVDRVEQMEVLGVLPPALDPAGLQTVTCRPQNEEWHPGLRLGDAELGGDPYCGRVKYHAMHRGPLRFDRQAFAGAPDVVKSYEWFGSGESAFRQVIASQRFRRVVTEAKWRGLGFEPIELVDAPPVRL